MQYQTAGASYFEASIRTAPPQRLRLMLVEKACQLCERTIALWQDGARAAAEEPALHLRDILGELLSGVGNSDAPLARQVADLYVFLLQWLTAAENAGEVDRLRDIARVLEIERETWRAVCQKLAEESRGAAPSAFPASPAPAGGLSLRA